MAHPFFGGLTTLVHKGTQRHLEWLYRITTRRPLLVFFVAVFLLLPASLSILSTRFEADIFKLFPAEKGPLKLFLDTLEWTGGSRQAIFLLEGNREDLVPEADAFAARLKAVTVDDKPAFSRITYRVFDAAEAEAFARFIGYAVTHSCFLTGRKRNHSRSG